MRKLAIFIVLLFGVVSFAQDLKPVTLPQPQKTGGKPLMQALSERKTSRDFSPEKLSPQVLSNLLWAAFGINRPDGHRTAPSAMNWQEIQIYVALADGLYVFNATENRLDPVLAQDLRATTGTQPFPATAPLNLVLVADTTKVRPGPDSDMYMAADAGFIAQNVYLYCASEGLATVVRGSVDRAALAKLMKLRPEQRIILAQTVGYPKK